MRVRIGVDVDGVLADMTSWVLDEVNHLRWLRACINHEPKPAPHTVADVVEWDYDNLLEHPEDRDTLRYILQGRGVCVSFEPYPHARELLERLGAFGEVWLVTSPMPGSDSWAGERIRWAQERLGVDRHRVAVMADKSAFDGRVLIDDRAQNLLEWEDGGVGRRGILWKQPYSGPWAGWWTQSVSGAEDAVIAALRERFGYLPRRGHG